MPCLQKDTVVCAFVFETPVFHPLFVVLDVKDSKVVGKKSVQEHYKDLHLFIFQLHIKVTIVHIINTLGSCRGSDWQAYSSISAENSCL